MTKDDVIRRLVAKSARLGSAAALAKDIGVSKAYVGDVVCGRREPGPTVLKYLGLEKRVRVDYVSEVSQ